MLLHRKAFDANIAIFNSVTDWSDLPHITRFGKTIIESYVTKTSQVLVRNSAVVLRIVLLQEHVLKSKRGQNSTTCQLYDFDSPVC